MENNFIKHTIEKQLNNSNLKSNSLNLSPISVSEKKFIFYNSVPVNTHVCVLQAQFIGKVLNPNPNPWDAGKKVLKF